MAKREKEVCPVCGEYCRDPRHPMCWECNKKFTVRLQKAERDGDVILVTRLEYARMKGKKTIERLGEEVALAEKDKSNYFEEARQQIKDELVAEGSITIDRTEFNRQVGKRFGELLGDPDRAKEIWDILNNHPGRIESIEKFLAQDSEFSSSEEGLEESESEKETVVV